MSISQWTTILRSRRRPGLPAVIVVVLLASLTVTLLGPAAADTEPDEATGEHPGLSQQVDAGWHLDRISQREPPFTGTYDYRYTGDGVRVYVLDTGTRVTHEDFEGRYVDGYDALGQAAPHEDLEGHGTEVASAAAGTEHGVAKGATVVSVRVLDPSDGSRQPEFEPFIGALDWILETHPDDGTRGVLNVSLDGYLYEDQPAEAEALESKLEELMAAGLVVVWAADTRGEADVLFAPERMEDVLVVGATTRDDRLLPGSNFGEEVALYAPGEELTLASNGSDTETDEKLGTSFAAPIVAGAAALVLEEDPSASVAEVRRTLLDRATEGAIADLPEGHNRLVYTLPVPDRLPTVVPLALSALLLGLLWWGYRRRSSGRGYDDALSERSRTSSRA